MWLPLALVACGGQTCNGCNGPLPKPQTPVELVTPAVVQARITQHGFDLIAANLVQVLQVVLGGNSGGGGNVAVIDVAKVLGPQPLQFTGGLGIFNGKAGVRDLVITFDLKSASMQLVDGSIPARIRLSFDHARIGAQKGVVFGAVSVIGLDSDAACHLKNGLGVSSQTPHLATFSGTLDVVLGVDSAGKLAIEVQVAKPVLHDIGFALAKDCALKECTDQFLLEAPCLECELCATGQLASDAIGAVKDLLGPLLTQILELAGNLVVKQVLAGAINGKPLDVEIPVDINALLAGASPLIGGLVGQSAGPVLMRTRPSSQAFVVNGGALRARLDAAVFSVAAPCVVDPGADATLVFAKLPQSLPPELPAQMSAFSGTGSATPTLVDVGVLVGNRALQQAGWSLLRSGLLCVNIDSSALYSLSAGQVMVTAGALDLVLPGIGQLAPAGAPIRIAVRPNASPSGAPFVQLHQEQTATVAALHLRDLGVAVEVFAHGRWLTLVELQVQATLVAAIQVLGQQLVLQVRQLNNVAIEVVGDPIAPAANWQQLAPAVAQLAVALLLAQPLQFEVDVQSTLKSLLNLPIAASVVGIAVTGADSDWLLLGIALKSGGPP
ncbi:MAG: hypothetical protein EXR77_01655 [Myxococcales bacterium]|nr:hypothetical protein [Myxococcales bacterium]